MFKKTYFSEHLFCKNTLAVCYALTVINTNLKIKN